MYWWCLDLDCLCLCFDSHSKARRCLRMIQSAIWVILLVSLYPFEIHAMCMETLTICDTWCEFYFGGVCESNLSHLDLDRLHLHFDSHSKATIFPRIQSLGHKSSNHQLLISRESCTQYWIQPTIRIFIPPTSSIVFWLSTSASPVYQPWKWMKKLSLTYHALFAIDREITRFRECDDNYENLMACDNNNWYAKQRSVHK